MAILKRKLNKVKKPENKTTELIVKLQNVKKLYVKYMTNLGAHVFHYGKFFVAKAISFIKTNSIFVLKKMNLVFRKLFGSVKILFKKPFIKPFAYCKNLKSSILHTKEKEGLLASIRYGFSCLGKSIWNSKKLFIKSLNYIAPLIAIVFLVNIVSNETTAKYAISVECNGEVLGYIDEEAVADEAQMVMQERINYVDGNNEVVVQPKLSVKKISDDTPVYSADELADKLISTSDVELEEAYGFYINGTFSGAVKDKTKLESTLASLLDKYRTNDPNEEVSFVDKYEIKDGLYLEEGIVDDDSIIELLNSEKQVEAYYTIVAGDAPTLIAEKVGLPYSELKALNPTIEDTCMIGQQVLINRAQPFASVRVTRDEVYDISLPYKTISVQDSSIYKGSQKTLVNGEEGSAHVSANVSYVNGYEETRTIISQETTKEPVDKKVAIGTKSTGAPQSVIDASGGNYMWPVGGNGGYISSYFGWRTLYGRSDWHPGIDIATSYGTPIYAVADGYVTAAVNGWCGGYGNNVVINHGNGYSTMYAHASRLNVSAGMTVKKGDLIAFVGSTGSSTGNHLHFEVRYYGQKYNPLPFLGR